MAPEYCSVEGITATPMLVWKATFVLDMDMAFPPMMDVTNAGQLFSMHLAIFGEERTRFTASGTGRFSVRVWTSFRCPLFYLNSTDGQLKKAANRDSEWILNDLDLFRLEKKAFPKPTGLQCDVDRFLGVHSIRSVYIDMLYIPPHPSMQWSRSSI